MLGLALAAAALLHAGAPPPAAGEPFRPGPRDRCPVCGMFVARYPEWIAGVVFRDGSRAVFDGAKDLLRFWLEPARFLPPRTREDVSAMFVTDYYTLAPVAARDAWLVAGSDVLGPMGHELVAFAAAEAAEEFRGDHGGTRVLRLDEVTAELLRSLDR
jgi:nitrous oxide reductase accessory protein NosL